MANKNEPKTLETTGFLSSQVSFDIEDDGEKLRNARRRKARTEVRPSRRKRKPAEDEHLDSCPGCGHEIPEAEFVDALLSFCTGATDYLEGEPVRVRSVQMMQQILAAGRWPEPRSEWLAEILNRLEAHIEKMAEERARLIQRQDWAALEAGVRMEAERKVRKELEENIREEMRNESQVELVQEIAAAIRPQIEAEVIAEIAPQIRKQVEAEMWAEVEGLMAREREKNSQPNGSTA